ncbi:MAG: hypothetical protein STHCBS139747_002653 [Sporothrix thermara]
MKFAIFALALAGSAVAQNLSGEPACASSCLVSAISAAGCAPGDVACQCGPTQSAIATLVAPCLLDGCSGPDLIQAQSAGLALCSLYSKTAGLPATASASATSTAAAVTSSASNATVAITSAPKATTLPFGNSTATTGTKTMTKGGASGAAASTLSSTAGAATLGAGVLAAFVGLVAAL